MNVHHARGIRPRLLPALAGAAVAAVLLPAAASAHATITPDVSLKGRLQLYSLAVPTEKETAATAKVVLTVPSGFSIDSFVPAPGWHRLLQQTGSGGSAVIQKVTWTGGRVPTGEDALFQFLAEPTRSETYTFDVQQTYTDGSVVNWSGPESGEDPAPTVQAKDSLGGGGTSVLEIVALGVAALALLAAALALIGGARHGGRPLA